MIRTRLLNKLVSIKLLINEAKRTITTTSIQRAFSILSAHDALDWCFQLAYCEPLIGGKKSTKMFLYDYAVEINKAIPGFIDLGNVSKINTIRNNYKHDNLYPELEITKELVSWMENQIDSIFKHFFRIPLEDVDLVVAIENIEIKNKITQADKESKEGKAFEALSNISIALEMVKNNLQNGIETLTGKKVIFRTDFSFSNSFFLDIGSIGSITGRGNGNRLANAWDQIINGLDYLIDMTFVNYLGLDICEYFQFQSKTPRPTLMRDGEYQISRHNRTETEVNPDEFDKCRNFVIDAAIKAQLKSLE